MVDERGACHGAALWGEGVNGAECEAGGVVTGGSTPQGVATTTEKAGMEEEEDGEMRTGMMKGR